MVVTRSFYKRALRNSSIVGGLGRRSVKGTLLGNRARPKGYGKGLSDAAKVLVAALKKSAFSRRMMGKTYKRRFTKIKRKRNARGYSGIVGYRKYGNLFH